MRCTPHRSVGVNNKSNNSEDDTNSDSSLFTLNSSLSKIFASIEESKKVPFERVLFAIGIRFVGEIAAKTLARYYGSMDKVAEASMESLMQINGIGEVIASSVVQYFANPINRAFVERLRGYGLQMEIGEQQKQAQSDKLAGQSVVISGVFQHHSRDEYKALIEQHGGKNVGSISAKTSFILAGDNMGPAKLEKAQKLGIRIMSEDEFLSFIEHWALEIEYWILKIEYRELNIEYWILKIEYRELNIEQRLNAQSE